MDELWAVAYAKMAEDVGLEREIARGHAIAAALVDPILGRSCTRTAHWNPAQRTWDEA